MVDDECLMEIWKMAIDEKIDDNKRKVQRSQLMYKFRKNMKKEFKNFINCLILEQV